MGNPIVRLPEGWKDELRDIVISGDSSSKIYHTLRVWIDANSATQEGYDPFGLPENYDTEAACVIFQEIMPRWIEEFLAKNSRYGETANLLGSKGQFADMWRKVGPLKRMLWDEEELIGESVEEVVRDLIGHCFLTLYYRQKEYEQAKRDHVEKIRAGARKKYQGENDLRPSGRDSLDDLVQHDMEAGK